VIKNKYIQNRIFSLPILKKVKSFLKKVDARGEKMPKDFDYPYIPSPYLSDLEVLKRDKQVSTGSTLQPDDKKDKGSERTMITNENDPTFS
jgi:hypothetical protein